MLNFQSLTRIAAIGTALAAGFLAMTPGTALAQTNGTWTANGSAQAATSTWGSTANWSSSNVAGGTNATATFQNTTNTFAGLTNNITLGNLSTNTGRLYITGTDNSFATQTPSSFAIEFATTTGTAPVINNLGRLDMLATVNGSQGYTKSGGGTLYLWAPNNYSGVTTISAGQVYLRNGNGLGASTTGNGTVVESGATLRTDLSGISVAEPLTIAGDGGGANGALRSNVGAATFSGPITLSASSSIRTAAGTSLTFTGAINTGSNSLSFEESGVFSVSGGIGGTGNLSYTGTGGLTLSGYNTLTGTTTVTNSGAPVTMTGYMAGPMVFNGSSRSLIGTGTFAGGLSVGSSNVLSPGASGTAAADSYGTITASTLEVQSATVRMGIQTASIYDQVVMTAGANGLTLGGTANLALNFANLLPNFSSLKLLDFTGLSGNFDSLVSTGSYAGTWTRTNDVWSLSVGSGASAQDLTFTQSTGVLAVVPEPSAIVLLGGSAAATVLFRLVRRRRVG
jgi:hypothetical protein